MLSALLMRLAVAWLVLGLPLVAAGYHFRSRIARFNARAVAAEGIVVGHRTFTITSSDVAWREMTEAVVQFRTQDGRLVSTKGPVNDIAAPPQPPIGTRVRLIYDPHDPEEVSLRGPRGQAGFASALFWLGIALCVGGAGAAVAQLAIRLGALS